MLLQQVNFKPIKRLLRNSKLHKNSSLKYLHNQWFTMRTALLWKETTSDLCPLCSKHQDTWQHVIQCPQIDTKRVRFELVNEMSKELTQLKTYPPMKDHFIYTIKAWNASEVIKQPQCSIIPLNMQMNQAHSHQQNIGFDNFIKGLHSEKWANVQQEYYDMSNFGKTYNIRRWENKVTELFLKYGHTIWKNRCELLHSESIATAEQRTREKAFNLCKMIVAQIWKIEPTDRHLLLRKKSFFETSNISIINMWTNRLLLAIKIAEKNSKKSSKIMEDWLKQSKKNNNIRKRKRNENKIGKNTTKQQKSEQNSENEYPNSDEILSPSKQAKQDTTTIRSFLHEKQDGYVKQNFDKVCTVNNPRNKRKFPTPIQRSITPYVENIENPSNKNQISS